MEHKRMDLRDVGGKNQQDWMNDSHIVNLGCVHWPPRSFLKYICPGAQQEILI